MEQNFGLRKSTLIRTNVLLIKKIKTTKKEQKVASAKQIMTIEVTKNLPSMKTNHDVGRDRI
jgi:hypothetical protein